MRKNTIETKILLALKEHEHTPKELRDRFGITRVAVHKHLKKLLADGNIRKIGSRPDVHYQFVRDLPVRDPVITSAIVKDLFMYITPVGEVLTGAEAFTEWSRYNLKKLPLEEKVRNYERCIREIQSLKDNGVYTLKKKLETFRDESGENIYLRDVVSAAPYALPDFGKTREAVLLEIAKGENVNSDIFAHQLVEVFFPPLLTYLRHCEPHAVAFVPPTARRKVQIMDILKNRFGDISPLPVVTVKKKKTSVIRQQKYLRTADERVRNARDTFVLDIPERPAEPYGRLLLIDDMVGSGATLNQIARKCIDAKFAETVYGIGIVGDRKGFKAERIV